MFVNEKLLHDHAANVLDNGRYVASAYGVSDTAPVHVLEGLKIILSDVLEE